MKKFFFLTLAIIVLSSHDMFLKMDGYFLKPNSPSVIHLYNGTIDVSENVITRDRMIDVSIVGNGARLRPDTTYWPELDSTITVLNFTSGDPGTWVAGVSTKARNIELSAEDFNAYLEHDGVLDILESRKTNGTIDSSAVEKYSKHVKAIFQVGDRRSEDWKTPLNYPIEFVPLMNPYDLTIGDDLLVQLLRNGKPLPDQLVYTGFSNGSHSHQDGADQTEHQHDENQIRTDADGIAKISLDHGGQWYVRTIHMVTSKESGLTHESNWATLTFEVA